MKLRSLSVRGVAAGFAILSAALAWNLYDRYTVQHRQAMEIQSLRQEVLEARHSEHLAVARLRSQEKLRRMGAIAAPGGNTISARAELNTLGWEKKRHMHVMVEPIHPFRKDALNSELAVMLGLTPEEFDQINSSIRQTQHQLENAAIRAATVHLSADGQKLIISVPPLSRAGDAAYAQLLNTIARVLGPERFQVFNAVAGESFDKSFGQFGLEPLTYQVTLSPKGNAGGLPRYDFRLYWAQPNGIFRGWINGSRTEAGLEKRFPVLRHFLPAYLGPKGSPSTGQN